MTHPFGTWRAPSLANLASDRIKLDCSAETVRAVWHATTNVELKTALMAHFATTDRFDARVDDLFHEARTLPGGGLQPFHGHKRELLNRLGGFHGVEYLGVHRRSGKGVRYCNAGDAYAPTLVFMGRVLQVACWGDLVEARLIREVGQ